MKLTGEKVEDLFPLLKREAKGTGGSEQQRDRSPSQDSSEYSFEKATMASKEWIDYIKRKEAEQKSNMAYDVSSCELVSRL
jgi:hypothetical protein